VGSHRTYGTLYRRETIKMGAAEVEVPENRWSGGHAETQAKAAED
jgi:hypothetical protein